MKKHHITLRYSKSHYNTVHYTTQLIDKMTLQTTTPKKNIITPDTSLHYTTPTKRNKFTFHYITVHQTLVEDTTLLFTTFHDSSLHYTTLTQDTTALQVHVK